MNKVLDQLVESCYCLSCGEILDGHIWNKGEQIAKPSYMRLNFCYFPCESDYERPFGFKRDGYDRTTKFTEPPIDEEQVKFHLYLDSLKGKSWADICYEEEEREEAEAKAAVAAILRESDENRKNLFLGGGYDLEEGEIFE